MKRIKILGVILAIIYTLTSFRVYASSDVWEYKWFNTVVNISIGDELTKYTKIPYAKLYRNGEELKDAYITYSIEGDWLYYLKDVDTTRVGTYYVWYKAFENNKYVPGTCSGYKNKITFVVEDKEAPELDIINSVIHVQRRKNNDNDLINELLNNNVNYKDNYSKCDIKFEHDVKLNTVGRYEVKVSVIDLSKNRTTGHFYVEVYDNSKPNIYSDFSDTHIKISKNSEIDLKAHFTAFDEIDGDLSSKINITSFDRKHIGENEVIVSVSNSGGNRAQLNLIIEICDDVSPSIKMSTSSVVLDYLEDFNTFDFSKYVVDIEDDEEINYDNLVITHNLENKIGNYYIKYSYSDGVNEATEQISVKLVSFKSPTLEVVDVELKEGNIIDLNQYVYVYDESDNYVSESLKIDDSNVDYTKTGTYFADVYCMNSSGQSNTKKMKIKITSSSEKTMNKDYIIIYSIFGGILAIGIFSGAFLFIKKKRKKKIKNER